MKILSKCHLLLVALLIVPMQATSEDIDLFLGAPTVRGAPNVLFVIDNTANWNSPFNAEKIALTEIFENLPDGINVGIMMFTETGGGDSNTKGGYVRAAIRGMGLTDPNDATQSYRDLYADLIGGLDVGDDKSNSGKAGLAMAEAYAYFSGGVPHAGNGKNKTDYGVSGTTNTYNTGSCCTDSLPVWALTDPLGLNGNALNTKGGTRYNSPVEAGACGRNYIIYLSNGAAQDSNSDNTTALSLLSAAGGDTTQLPISPSGSADVAADEWTRFMREDELGITTFAIDVNPILNGQGPGWSRLLFSMAGDNPSFYYEVDTNDPNEPEAALSLAFDDILGKILAENSVFASVALPAASNAQSTFLNRVYIGQFRPDGDGKPKWPGNLKLYKLGLDGNSNLILQDADDDRAIEVTSDSAFIGQCARSYWTPTIADSYWAFEAEPLGSCAGTDPTSNTPDGAIVEKGGQAYTRRASTTRTVYTCDPVLASCTTLTDFVPSNGAITDALLDANDPTDGDNLINWARGINLDDEDGLTGGIATTDMRPTVHGDVIHSQPVALDYTGDPNNPQIVVYYSANDGMLRAINGNRTASVGSVGAGDEYWAFMPPEFYGSIKTLRKNDDRLQVPASGPGAVGGTGIPKPYGFDGPISSFAGDLGGTAKKYLYAGMRRSGRALYAFDVTTAASPAMLWKKGCPNLANDTNCSVDAFRLDGDAVTNPWDWLGQTWSRANVAFTPTSLSGTDMSPLLVMGGGYDGCEDYDGGTGFANHQCTSTDKGGVIYILDGVTGNILNAFKTDRAVSGAVTVVPFSDNDNRIIYAYAADMGGNVYRISGGTAMDPAPISTTDAASSWIMTKIASLGCDTSDGTCTAGTANRKFLFAPDVVKINGTNKLAVLLGSGDREKPLREYSSATAVENYFFSMVDDPEDENWLIDGTGTCSANVICPALLTQVTIAGDVTPGDRGFRLPLAADEQAVTGALVVNDIANFSTHIPFNPSDPNAPTDPNDPGYAGACASNLGTATTYNINFQDAEGETVDIIGGGLVPTPVAGRVVLDDGTIVPFCIGCGGENSAIGGSKVGGGISWSQPKSRAYWNIQK